MAAIVRGSSIRVITVCIGIDGIDVYRYITSTYYV